MKQVLLSDVCEINPRMDSSISDDTECSFVPMEYVDDISGTIAQTGIRQVGDVKKGYTFFKNDDVIFAKITPCMENGKCAVGKNLKNGIAFGSTEFHVIRAKQEIIPEWIYYFLRQEHVRQSAKQWFRGTAGQQRVPSIFLEELKIPLPPLTEQKRIASLLARADRLRGLRRTAHDLGESLLQSVFLEMFEKVRGNTKEALLGEISDIASGVTKGHDYKGKATVEVPYLRVANVQDGYLDLSEIKTIQALPSEVEELRLQIGDVVMTEGGDYDKLGRGAIWRGGIENCIHQNHIFRVRLNRSKVIPEFFENYLLSPEAKKYFLGASKQTTNLASINMTQLKKLPVPLYPLSLQEEFASVVAWVESLRGRMGESTRQVEGLFESLLSQSFGG